MVSGCLDFLSIYKKQCPAGDVPGIASEKNYENKEKSNRMKGQGC